MCANTQDGPCEPRSLQSEGTQSLSFPNAQQYNSEQNPPYNPDQVPQSFRLNVFLKKLKLS